MSKLKECETKAGIDGDGLGVLSWNDEPYGPVFRCFSEADKFVAFVGNRTGLDPRHQSTDRLEILAAEFRGRGYR